MKNCCPVTYARSPKVISKNIRKTGNTNMELNTKYGEIKIYAKTLEDAALAQIIKIASSPLGEGAQFQI